MLSMQMKSGDYVTIGDNVVVQVFKESGPQFRISIRAPREVPIVRGKVLEREGKQRPEGLRDKAVRKSPSDKRHAAIQLQRHLERQAEKEYRAEEFSSAMEEIGIILDAMSAKPGFRKEVTAMRRQMERIAYANGDGK